MGVLYDHDEALPMSFCHFMTSLSEETLQKLKRQLIDPTRGSVISFISSPVLFGQ